VVLISLSIIYLTITFWFGFGWFRKLKPNKQMKPVVSVIIATHNEAQNLANCLEALTWQDYPADKFELVVVNDRSTDATAAVLSQWSSRFSRFRTATIYATPASIAPKKYALKKGIEVSCNEILCFTDADCQPPAHWLSDLTAEFTQDVGMVVGLAPLTTAVSAAPPLWQKLLVYESWLNNLFALAAIRQGFPLSCTGRNLAYRKTAFNQIQGFNEIAHSLSGDDDLLMHLIQKKTSWQIAAMADSEAAVTSKTVGSLRQLWTQRTRHFSTGKYYPIEKKLFYLIWHGTTILLTLMPILALAIPALSFWFAVQMLAIKWVADFIFHWLVFKRNGQLHLLKYFIPFELINPIYLLIVGTIGWFKPPQWQVSDAKKLPSETGDL